MTGIKTRFFKQNQYNSRFHNRGAREGRRRQKRRGFLFLIFFVSFRAFAFPLPGDNDYLILEEKRFRVIFDKQHLPSIDKISRKIKFHLEAASRFQDRVLDGRLTVVLVSSKAQIPNAFASIYPSPTIVLYPSGAAGLNNEVSLPDWFEGIFEHELNHIFQMSHSKSPAILRQIFRIPGFWFFYLHNPYPNLFLPRFVLEGDSVLKESLQGGGGRLFNGAARALVYSQLKHHRHQPLRFMKKNLLSYRRTAHSGNEKYLHGGYFTAMLTEAYSYKTVSGFFKPDKKKPSKKIRKQINDAPIKRFLSPLLADHFSFQNIRLFLPNLTKAYFNRYMKEAAQQKSSSEPALFKSAVCPAFGAEGNDVFFMTSDLKSIPVMRIFSKKTKKQTSKKADLPLDKLFKINGEYYARSAQEIKPHLIHYSLFSKGLRDNKRFDSMYVQDIRGDKVLYIDSKNSLDGFKLYLNDSFLSRTNSNALFDKNGNVFFFKQKGRKRVLYKNKQPVFSYTGFYGEVLDIESDGTIYWTGASPYGSSVYQYKKGRIFRSLSSDTVVRAKSINDKEFIACEITPFGYEYKIIPKKPHREEPAFYKYKFLQTAETKGRAPGSFAETPARRAERLISSSAAKEEGRESGKEGREREKEGKPQTEAAAEEYSPLKHIRYKTGSLQGIFLVTGGLLASDFLFADYLQRHNFILNYIAVSPARLTDSLHLFGLTYLNRVFPLEWKLGYRSVFSIEDFVSDTGLFEMHYPLFKKGRRFSSLSALKMLQRDEKSSGLTGLFRGQINYGYKRSFPYNYTFNRSSAVRVFFDHRYEKKLNGFKSGAVWDAALHIGKEFYLFPSLSYARSFHPKINPAEVSLYDFSADSESPASDEGSSFSHSFNPQRREDLGSVGFVTNDLNEFIKSRYGAESAAVASLGLKKAIDISFAGAEIRLAPLARVRGIVLENLSEYNTKTSAQDRTGFSETGDLQQTVPAQKLSEFSELSEKETKKSVKESEQYLKRLEWTLGFEVELMAAPKLILGFGYGFLTPLKFWENGARDDSPQSAEPTSIGGSIDKPLTQTDPASWTTNFYFKAPL